MKRMFFRFHLLLLVLSVSSFAQPSLDQPIPSDPNVKIGKLANGLTYYIRKNEKPHKKVELRLAVNAGSVLERDDQQGLAHFVEHMAFNGSKNFKKNEIISYLQSIGVEFGADLNAYTTYDETVYRLSIPTDKPEVLEKGFLILEDWAADLTLEEAEIDKERGVVLEELRSGRGADERMRAKYFPYLFYGSQYAKRPPLGQKQIIETFNRQSLVDFYEEWYRPDLMAVIAVGDLDVDAVEAKIKAQFGKIRAKRPIVPRPVVQIPDHQETFVAVETDIEAQIALAQIYYKKPPVKIITQADLRQNLVKSFFDSMLNARIEEIRQSPDSPFVLAGMGFNGVARDKSAYFMFGASPPENLEQTISTLLLENRRVRQFGFTAPEFERRKALYLENLEQQFKGREQRASDHFAAQYVVDFLTHSVSPGIEFDYRFGKSVVPTITLAEIDALAKDTVQEKNRVVVITGLADESIKYPTSAEVLNLMKSAETVELEPYSETVLSGPLVGKLPLDAKILEEKTNDRIVSWTLSNGVKVILKPATEADDKITMTGYSPGGLSLVSDEKALSGALASDFINERASLKNLSRAQLNKILAGKNINVQLRLGEMFESLSGSSAPADAETMLQLAYLKFTEVDFQKTEFDSYITQLKKVLPAMLANPENYFNERVSQTLNQNNPRYFSLFDPEKLGKVNLDDVRAVYHDRFSDASDFTFQFTGNFDREKIKPLILQYLGNLPAKNRKETGRDSGYRELTGKIEKVIKKGSEQKSLVKIRFSGEARYSPEEDRLLIALGELLSIKLLEILREEKSGVYNVGAGGTVSRFPYERYLFSISFPCAPENVESLVKAALDEIKEIQNGQIDDSDLAKVRESSLIGDRELFNDGRYWYESYYNDLVYGGDKTEEAYEPTKEITKIDLQKAAQKYLKIEERQQFILMPEDKK